MKGLRFSGGYCTNREGVRFEGKSCSEKLTQDFWPTYSAFANTSGGIIVMGLREEGRRLRVEGVKCPDHVLGMLWDQVNNPQKASINLLDEDDVETIEVDGSTLIAVRVRAADRHFRPVYVSGSMNSGTYRRNGEGDYHCTPAEIAAMVRDASDEPLDLAPCRYAVLKDLDDRSVESFRNVLSARNPGHPWLREGREEFLRLIGAAGVRDGEQVPTIAGLLMFGRDYCIRSELTNYFLDYREYDVSEETWSQRMTSDTGDWTGNIWDFFTYVSNRIFLLGEKPLRVEGFARVDDNDLIKAQREMIANALIHADYHGRRGVVVERRPDRLMTMNPGSFRVPIDQAVRGGRSDPRNPTVMKMLMLTGMVERAGSGMSVIMGACRELGAGTPKFTEETDPDTVTCTMPISPSSSGCVTERVLSMIVRDSKASINSMSDALGVPRSEVVGAVNALKADGVLRREGGTRGSWRIERGEMSLDPSGSLRVRRRRERGRSASVHPVIPMPTVRRPRSYTIRPWERPCSQGMGAAVSPRSRG